MFSPFCIYFSAHKLVKELSSTCRCYLRNRVNLVLKVVNCQLSFVMRKIRSVRRREFSRSARKLFLFCNSAEWVAEIITC